MKTRYSKTTRTFYPLDVNYPDLPDDLIEVPIEAYQAAMARPAGHAFDFVDGELIITEIQNPQPTYAELLDAALAEVRAQRAPVLDALDGIANRAFRKGDVETAEAADAAAEQLLDITELPAFLAAQTRDEMKAAIMGRYQEIAEAVPVSVQSAFREVMG